jgi:GlpG protein
MFVRSRLRIDPLRQIGTLPRSSDPTVLGDYLLSQGVTSRAIESNDGWAIWVHNEDHIPRALEALTVYERNPADPRFSDATRQAREAQQESERLDRHYRQNVRDLATTWDRVPWRRRPLTMLLIGACVALYVAARLSPPVDRWLDAHWLFFPSNLNPHALSHGLDAIARGEIWRLVTPVLLHGGLIHLLFNAWAMLVLSTLVETRHGTLKLLALVAASAVVSNVTEYLFDLFLYKELAPWVGISGVVYALFGYLWIKGVVDPEAGLILHPLTVRIFLLWLLVGFFGPMRMPGGAVQMANGAHLGGLLTGMLFGLARF